jgi:hypothetical protein
MAKQIKIRVVLNKGRKGVPLGKLSKILAELYAFLDDMAEDLGVKDGGGWQGIQFKNSSLDFLAVKNTVVDDEVYVRFNESARHVIENSDDRSVTRRTRAQYAKIAAPLDPDEAVGIGIENYEREMLEGPLDTEDEKSFEWHSLDKVKASRIEDSVRAKIRSFASIQGTIHSLYIEADKPHFALRELSTKDLINCYYTDVQYAKVAKSLESKGAVLFVHGFAITDMMTRKIEGFEVKSIIEAPKADSQTLARFIGCVPGLVPDEDLQAQIDLSRRRGE